jgi:hypothetical protein
MKKFFMFLTFGILIIIALICFYLFYPFGYKKVGITRKLTKTEIIDEATTYLTNKYKLNKSDVELIDYKEVFFDDIKTGIPHNNMTNIKYRIKNEKDVLVLCHWPKSKVIFTDDYQAKEISDGVLNYFKSLLGDKVIYTDFLFYPKAASRTWLSLFNTDSFLNEYKNDISNFFEDEYLQSVDIYVRTSDVDRQILLNDYSAKFDIFAKEYCSKLDKWSEEKELNFQIHFVKETSMANLFDLKPFDKNMADSISPCSHYYLCLKDIEDRSFSKCDK